MALFFSLLVEQDFTYSQLVCLLFYRILYRGVDLLLDMQLLATSFASTLAKINANYNGLLMVRYLLPIYITVSMYVKSLLRMYIQ